MATQLEHAQIENVQRVSRTTDLLGQDLEALTEAAPTLLTQWIDFLQGQQQDDLVDELENLRGCIRDEDDAAVAQSLDNLIDLTDEAAERAEGPVAEHLGELARGLQQLMQRADAPE
jgi:uncharacterized membrane protein YccC